MHALHALYWRTTTSQSEFDAWLECMCGRKGWNSGKKHGSRGWDASWATTRCCAGTPPTMQRLFMQALPIHPRLQSGFSNMFATSQFRVHIGLKSRSPSTCVATAPNKPAKGTASPQTTPNIKPVDPHLEPLPSCSQWLLGQNHCKARSRLSLLPVE